MKNINKMIKEFENMPKEDLVRSVKQFFPELDTKTLLLMSVNSLAKLVVYTMLLAEIQKAKETQRDLMRYYRRELASDKVEQERAILETIAELEKKYQEQIDKIMKEYFSERNDEDVENEKRIQQIMEKHRKLMEAELSKQIRREREQREKEEELQREAQRKGVQCSDDEELIM